MPHNPKLRFGLPLAATTSRERFNPTLADAPSLPVVDFAAVGKTAPTPLTMPGAALPRASAVVICWTDAEWAALQHVFCGDVSPLPYSARLKGTWPGWQEWRAGLPHDAPNGWSYWGYYRLAEIQGAPILLLKSNTHLDFPVQLLISEVRPTLIMSTGTAGGAEPSDHVGTVRAVSAGTLYETGEPASAWPTWRNSWQAGTGLLDNPNFGDLLFPVPATSAAIAALVDQYNRYFNSNLTQAGLDPAGLNVADAQPAYYNQTGGAVSLLTTPTFVVATTAGNLADYAAIEMDDAVIAKACGASASFAFVRNLSDPAQGANLPVAAQQNWGSAVYDTFGFYTAFNGAVVAWAMLN
jgi:hypothetical protein